MKNFFIKTKIFILNAAKKILFFIGFEVLRRDTVRYASYARYKSNKILKNYCANVSGNVLSIGSANDSDKTGSKYKEYFKNAEDYKTLEYEEGQSDLVADIQNMPDIKSESYDCIFCIWVLEHVKNVDSAFSEIFRILKKGGKFIFAVPLNQVYHGYPRDYWRFSKEDIYEILKKNNFEIQKIHKAGKDKDFVLDQKLNFYGNKVYRGPPGYTCLAIKSK